MSATASTILPEDFSTNTTDSDRYQWTPGKMFHLVAALNGAPVNIVADTMTGFTLLDVTLEDVRQTPGWGTYQVLVVATYNGEPSKTWYSLDKVGAIMILNGSRADSRAVEDHRGEGIAATRYVFDHNEISDRMRSGKWEVSVGCHGVTVSVRDRETLDFEYWKVPRSVLSNGTAVSGQRA